MNFKVIEKALVLADHCICRAHKFVKGCPAHS